MHILQDLYKIMLRYVPPANKGLDEPPPMIKTSNLRAATDAVIVQGNEI